MAHSVLLHIFVRSPGVTLTNQSDPTRQLPPTRVVSFDLTFLTAFGDKPKAIHFHYFDITNQSDKPTWEARM